MSFKSANNPRILDQALFRRFDDVLHYHLPEKAEIERLIDNRLGSFRSMKMRLETSVKSSIKQRFRETAVTLNMDV